MLYSYAPQSTHTSPPPSTMRHISHTIAVCATCASCLDGSPDPSIPRDRPSAISRLYPPSAGYSLVPDPCDDGLGFGWSPCELCEDTRGGTRRDVLVCRREVQ